MSALPNVADLREQAKAMVIYASELRTAARMADEPVAHRREMAQAQTLTAAAAHLGLAADYLEQAASYTAGRG